MKRYRSLVFLTLLLCLGCGKAGPVMYPVSGNVTWNKTPLAAGYINFEPLNASQTASGGPIVNGSYSAKASAGKNRVTILATRATTTVDSQMGAAPREQYLPARYNTESKLEAEISASSKNQFDFELVEMP